MKSRIELYDSVKSVLRRDVELFKIAPIPKCIFSFIGIFNLPSITRAEVFLVPLSFVNLFSEFSLLKSMLVVFRPLKYSSVLENWEDVDPI